MLATIVHHFPLLTFLMFYAVVIATALAYDRLFRHRAMPASLALSFGFGLVFLWFCQYWTNAWMFFTRVPYWMIETFDPSDWTNFILWLPDLMRWYILPLYLASLAIRLTRKKTKTPTPATSQSPNTTPAPN